MWNSKILYIADLTLLTYSKFSALLLPHLLLVHSGLFLTIMRPLRRTVLLVKSRRGLKLSNCRPIFQRSPSKKVPRRELQKSYHAEGISSRGNCERFLQLGILLSWDLFKFLLLAITGFFFIFLQWGKGERRVVFSCVLTVTSRNLCPVIFCLKKFMFTWVFFFVIFKCWWALGLFFYAFPHKKRQRFF